MDLLLSHGADIDITTEHNLIQQDHLQSLPHGIELVIEKHRKWRRVRHILKLHNNRNKQNHSSGKNQ